MSYFVNFWAYNNSSRSKLGAPEARPPTPVKTSQKKDGRCMGPQVSWVIGPSPPDKFLDPLLNNTLNSTFIEILHNFRNTKKGKITCTKVHKMGLVSYKWPSNLPKSQNVLKFGFLFSPLTVLCSHLVKGKGTTGQSLGGPVTGLERLVGDLFLNSISTKLDWFA